VAARDDEREGRVLDGRVLEDDRIDVPLDVIDADERLPQRVGHRLRVGEPDEERADEPRPLRHGDAVNLLGPQAGARERLLDDFDDLVQMLARGDLRYHAAEAPVRLDLRGDDGRDHLAPAAHQRGRRLVARTLDPQNQHMPTIITRGCARAHPAAGVDDNGLAAEARGARRWRRGVESTPPSAPSLRPLHLRR
jgi:hypothetical protein